MPFFLQLKNEQKEAFKAYIQMKKEKEEEKLRQWRERYGNVQDDNEDDDDASEDTDDDDDDHSSDGSRKNRKNKGTSSTTTTSFSRKSKDEKFQAYTKMMTEHIEQELQKSEVSFRWISKILCNIVDMLYYDGLDVFFVVFYYYLLFIIYYLLFRNASY